MNPVKRLLFIAALVSALGWQFGRAVAEVAKPLARALFALALALSTSIVW